jgi:hypothetical protein
MTPSNSDLEYERQRTKMNEDLLNTTRSTENSSWNALLTFNAIIISVFSVASVTVQTGHLPIILLILCCLLSSAAIILNFVFRREQTLRFFELFMEGSMNVDKEHIDKLKRESAKTNRMFANIRRREKFAYWLLLPEAALIIWILFSGKPQMQQSPDSGLRADTISHEVLKSNVQVDSLEAQKTKAGTAPNKRQTGARTLDSLGKN